VLLLSQKDGASGQQQEDTSLQGAVRSALQQLGKDIQVQVGSK